MDSWSWRKSTLLLGICAFGAASTQVAAQDEVLLEVGELGKGEAEQDNPTARSAWSLEVNGPVTAAFRKNEFKQANLHNTKKNAPGPKWVNVGPYTADYQQNGGFTGQENDSGRAREILFHPESPNTVYFLTSGGGLWRTDNWNATNPKWTALTDNITTTGGGSVAFGRNPNHLYLGLGDPYDQILVGGAVTKSKNGGVSWSTAVELGNTISIRDLKVDTSTNKDIVLVGTENGLFRSADEGASFSAIPTFAGLSVWSIVRSSAGWLATAQPCPAPAGSRIGVICNTDLTIYLSTDRGATWAPISNAGGVFANNGRTTLAVAKPGEAVVYAYANNVNDLTTLKDVYRSSDGGQTWVANNVGAKAPTNPVTGQTNMNVCGGQCWYDQSIGVDPNDPTRNTVWIGGSLSTASTTDGGGTWTLRTWWLPNQFPLPYAHADHHMLAFKTTGTPQLILGTDGGLSVSSDNGVTFSGEKNDGLISHLYYSIAGNPKFPNLILGGLQDNGTRLRTDNSGVHNAMNGGDGMGAAYSQDNTNTSLYSSQGSGIRANFSNNEPEFTQEGVAATSGISDTGFGFFTAVTAAPPGLDSSGRVFFHFSNRRVWKTVSGGIATGSCTAGAITVASSAGCGWRWIGSQLAGGNMLATRSFRSTPYNLGVSPTDINRIAVGAQGFTGSANVPAAGYVEITTNNGTTWTDVDLNAASGFSGFVSNVIWQDNQNLWVTSVSLATGGKRVVKGTIANPTDSWSTATWQVMQNGLPDLPVTRLYFDPRDPARNTIYAATHVGIYRTINGGGTWSPFGNGLPTVRVNDIYMPPDGSFIRLATYGRGIWQLAQIELENSVLVDNTLSCDNDGAVDNGEQGTLTITLRNQGPNNVTKGTLTFTSDNPNVTFPKGNKVPVPPMNKGAAASASVVVAVAGATGIENVNISVGINAPELALPSSFNVTSSHRVNYSELANGSATETFEAANPVWSIAGGALNLPNVNEWQRRALSFNDHVAYGPDNNGQADDFSPGGPDEQILTSPVLSVGAGDLGISFRHRWAFEATGWDGGVIELSNDGGATWVDIGGTKYTNNVTATITRTNSTTLAPIGTLRPAFVNRPISWPAFTNLALTPVSGYSNQNVQVRFRIGADESSGAPGWEIDDIAFTGITNTPFTALVPDSGVCTP